MFTRQRYQHGSFRRVKRKKGPPMWEFRFRDLSQHGHPQRQMTLSTVDFPTEAQARRHVEALVWKLNADTPQRETTELSFGALCDLFIHDEHLEHISKLKPGEDNLFGGLKLSTARGYLQIINKHIRPKWGTSLLSQVRAAQVADWLKQLELKPLTKAHIKALMSRLFKKAMLWELLDVGENPMSLVEVRGSSKRKRKPLILTVEQCSAVRE